MEQESSSGVKVHLRDGAIVAKGNEGRDYKHGLKGEERSQAGKRAQRADASRSTRLTCQVISKAFNFFLTVITNGCPGNKNFLGSNNM